VPHRHRVAHDGAAFQASGDLTEQPVLDRQHDVQKQGFFVEIDAGHGVPLRAATDADLPVVRA